MLAIVAPEIARPRRMSEGGGRRRSSSADEYEGKLELLVFGPNSKQRHVLLQKKAMKVISAADKPICGVSLDDTPTLDCSFSFDVRNACVHVTTTPRPPSPPPPTPPATDPPQLQFYTSPSTLHTGIPMDNSPPFPRSPFTPNLPVSPGTHVRVSFLQRVERAPEIEEALM